jgi:predicted metal-dependent peptidase
LKGLHTGVILLPMTHNHLNLVHEFPLSMAKGGNNTQTTETNPKDAEDKFWGQPHYEGEVFHEKEFEQDFLQVYMHEPFLGGVSLGISKVVDPTCSTAYVGINKETQELIMGFNPYFFRSMQPHEREGVIIHELYHVVLQHLFERNVTDKKYAMAWNIGTDLAINSIIGHLRLPTMALIPGRIPSRAKEQRLIDFIKNVKPLQASEFYFEGVKKILDEMEENGEGTGDMGTLDDHSGWGELPESVKDQIKDKVRGMLQNAVNRADSKNSWGTVPSAMQAEIRKGLQHEVDWRSILRMFFGIARSMQRISTIKKVSRKMPGILPGVKRGTMARFAFFIDQSGSMSDEDVALCFTEVEGACKETEIDVYNFDTEIDEDSHKVWKRGKKFPWGRTRCGGTDFNAVARFVNDKKNFGRWSGICILTDGYAPALGHVRGAKVLWVITPSGTCEVTRPGDLIVQMKKDKQFKQALAQGFSELP